MSVPFSDVKEYRIFAQSLNNFIFKEYNKKMSAYMSPENMYTLHHGNSFSSTEDNESKLTKHAVNIEFEYSNIRLYKIEQFYVFITDFIEQISSQMKKTLYKTLSNTCEKTGNTIDAKEKKLSNPEAFLEMIKKVEFGVDKNGKVLIPNIHLHPDQATKFMDDIKAQGEEYSKLVSMKELIH